MWDVGCCGWDAVGCRMRDAVAGMLWDAGCGMLWLGCCGWDAGCATHLCFYAICFYAICMFFFWCSFFYDLCNKYVFHDFLLELQWVCNLMTMLWCGFCTHTFVPPY